MKKLAKSISQILVNYLSLVEGYRVFAYYIINDSVEFLNIPITFYDEITNCTYFHLFKHFSVFSFFNFESQPLMIFPIPPPYPLSPMYFLFLLFNNLTKPWFWLSYRQHSVMIGACSSRTLPNSC